MPWRIFHLRILSPVNVNQKEVMLSVRYITVKIMYSDCNCHADGTDHDFGNAEDIIPQLTCYKLEENNLT